MHLKSVTSHDDPNGDSVEAACKIPYLHIIIPHARNFASDPILDPSYVGYIRLWPYIV